MITNQLMLHLQVKTLAQTNKYVDVITKVYYQLLRK